jgi:hypothetical protein
MTKDQFVLSDRIVANYFVPFTSGKFIMSCLMLHPEVYPALSLDQLFDRLRGYATHWNQVEYSDIDFWWKDYNHDWFNSSDWFDYLAKGPIEAIAKDQYIFYSVHEPGTSKFLTNIFPNAKILVIVPDWDLCKKNYLAKNWFKDEPEFETSRIRQDFDNFRMLDTDLVFHQAHIYDESLFAAGIQDLCNKLKIKVDMDLVLKYREHYLNSSFNK